MNKNYTVALIIVILLGLGLWWFMSHTKTSDTVTPTATVTASSSPNSSASPSPTSTAAQPAITITSPKANEAVDPVITVTGRARVFENQFTVQALIITCMVVYQAHVMTDAKTSGVYGNYAVKIPISAGNGSTFKIQAFSLSAKGDGSYEGFASVSVKLKTTDTSNVYVAFMAGDSCSAVTLYPRVILKSTQFPYLSVVELLKGPGPQETAQGASTQIPGGVTINSYRQTGDTVYVDFDQTLQQGVAGSCRVQAIRSQITNTLKQFLGVNNVVISINGKTDGILQP